MRQRRQISRTPSGGIDFKDRPSNACFMVASSEMDPRFQHYDIEFFEIDAERRKNVGVGKSAVS